MSSPSPSLRKRGGRRRLIPHVPSDDASLLPAAPARAKFGVGLLAGHIVLTCWHFATRFYRIDYPNEVVFDEVHFGKVWIRLEELSGRLSQSQEGIFQLTLVFPS